MSGDIIITNNTQSKKGNVKYLQLYKEILYGIDILSGIWLTFRPV